MLWELEIQPKGRDREQERIREEYRLLTHAELPGELIFRCTHGYLLEGDLDRARAERLMTDLLVDPLSESAVLGESPRPRGDGSPVTVLLKPGVMDPAA